MIATKEQLNTLLLKQIERKFGKEDDLPPEMMELLRTVSRTYENYERERQLIERAMDLSSNEMIEANNKLAEQAQKLQRSNQELQELAFAVSHDLKEPLRTIASYIQLIQLRMKDQLDSEITEFMNFSVSGVKRLQSMLEGMLKYSQVNEENKDFTSQDLNVIMQSVLDNLRDVIAAKHAKVTITRTLPRIKGNRLLLIQLFQNLIGNSIKFHSADAPLIELSYIDQPGNYQFTITDNGIGMAGQDKQKLFSMFRRGHNGEYDGVGMGLSICKKIVESHGGSIWIGGDIQQGTRINFTLPK